MDVKTEAVVLQTIDYKDNDKLLTLFSPTMGKITAGIRGVKKPKAKRLKGFRLSLVKTWKNSWAQRFSSRLTSKSKKIGGIDLICCGSMATRT